MNRRYEKYERDPETAEKYSGSWKKIRAIYAAEHPLCEQCLKEGRYVRMEHVHHIIPLSEGGTNDPGNLMSLCKSCHSRIHAEHGDRWHKEVRR
jgi:5-methylcytosine-specific restriction protein A